MRLTLETTQLILDGIYQNAIKPQSSQKNLHELSRHLGTSVQTLSTFRNLLKQEGLLVLVGERNSQIQYWNPEMCPANTHLARRIFSLLTKDYKRQTAKRNCLSINKVLKYLIDQGYEGVIKKTSRDGFISVTTSIDLSEVHFD